MQPTSGHHIAAPARIDIRLTGPGAPCLNTNKCYWLTSDGASCHTQHLSPVADKWAGIRCGRSRRRSETERAGEGSGSDCCDWDWIKGLSKLVTGGHLWSSGRGVRGAPAPQWDVLIAWRGPRLGYCVIYTDKYLRSRPLGPFEIFCWKTHKDGK